MNTYRLSPGCRFLLLCGVLAGWCDPALATDRFNDPAHLDKPYVILISIDGYRWDYPDLYPRPNLQRLEQNGVRAHALNPVWPTLTFPNHYSIATGLVPARHGIVANDFPDPASGRWYALRDRKAVGDGYFYGGTPLWVAAMQQGMLAASYFWVGSEAAIQGVRPQHWYPYDDTVTTQARVEEVLRWLRLPEAQRPHLITLYFAELDSATHDHGPGSTAFGEALDTVDRALGDLLDGLASVPGADQTYVVVVSDHGQTSYKDLPPFIIDEHMDLTGLTLVNKGTVVFGWQTVKNAELAAQQAERINAVWDHGKVRTRATAPARWQMGGNPRFPDLVFQADEGHAVVSSAAKSSYLTAGDHGWDGPSMQGIFMATGPGIPAASRIDAINVVDVYPLVMNWLGLDIREEIDGRAPVLPAPRSR